MTDVEIEEYFHEGLLTPIEAAIYLASLMAITY